MIKNYFKIALRNLIRNRSYAAINIIGLGVSIAACLLIGFFVYNERNFDNTVPAKDNVYRLTEYMHYDGVAPQLSAAIGPPIASFLKDNHQEIEAYTRVLPATPFIYNSLTLEYDGKKFKSNQLACADSTFADMFGITILEGDRNRFIYDQNGLVLTQSVATKLFGQSSPLNKTVAIHTNDTTFYRTVSHIIADFTKTSHLQLDGILPVPRDFENGFLGTNYGVLMGPVYVRLKPGTNSTTLQAKLTKTIHSKNNFIDIGLQPLTQVHLSSTDINYDYFNYNKMDGKYIRIFIVIALAIFIIATINFINLTIAIAGYRGKEIAIKKVMGAKRMHILFQVFTETFLSVFIALLVSLVLAIIFMPFLNTILHRDLELKYLYDARIIGVYTIILLVTTLLAGSYPAWLIASAKVNQALKTKILLGPSRTTLRNILVTGQFTIAAAFIVSLLVFIKQLRFLQEKDLGYSYNKVIKINLDATNATKLPIMRSQLLKTPGVSDVTNGFIELGKNGSLFGIDYIAPDGQSKHISANFENAGTNYVSFFDMKILAGNSFRPDHPGNEYLVNETLAKKMGYTNPVGKQINLTSFPSGVVVGMVKDFNYSSLHGKIEPLLISSISDVPVWQSQLYVKIATADIAGTLKNVGATLQSVSGDKDLNWQFMDEHFKQVYKSERQAGTMVAIIGGLAITIACFGLLSLAAFMILRRTKEIGIRKVIGASVNSISLMLSKEFMKLTLISILIAFPVAWWAMNNWLEGFAYRITIGPSIFIIAGLFVALITLITVSFQAIKAAFANPVKSLRNE
ncbi:MAG: FtsX-like permease family protein [Chitinophagaceae bacterium]